jgi:hypothetical protein
LQPSASPNRRLEFISHQWQHFAALCMGLLGLGVSVGLVVLPSVASSAQPRSPVERELEWVLQARPEHMLADSLARGRSQFLEVCGNGCMTPNVRLLTYHKCYSHAARVLRVDSTSHIIMSPRHGELKEQVYEFAKAYDSMLLDTLDSRGKRHCPPNERWDDYWHAIDSIAHAIPARPHQSFVLASTAVGHDARDFSLHVQDERDISNTIFAAICSLAPRYGLGGRITFSVTSGNINNHPKKHSGFACVGGVRSERVRSE